MKRLLASPLLPVILILVCFASLAANNWDDVKGWRPNIIGPEPVTAAVIVEESKDRPKLPKEIIAVMVKAEKHGVKVFDPNQTDKDGKVPPVLAPFFQAAGTPLPQLVTRRGQDKYESRPCPKTEAELVEALK